MIEYQADPFRNFPLSRSDEVSEVPIFGPRKDQPDLVVEYIFHESLQLDDIWVIVCHYEFSFTKS